MRYYEIVAIGDEVLAGLTVNSNAAFISQAMLEIGLQCMRHTVIPDIPNVMEEALENALKRSPLVITCGGLGPTLDDRTRKVLADLFHTELAYNEEVAAHLRQRYGDKLGTLHDQATIPLTATPLHNEVGTAPGLILRKGDSTLIALPGVPLEMRTMVEERVKPYVAQFQKTGIRQFRRILNLFRATESSVDEKMREMVGQYPDLKMGIYPKIGVVSAHFIAEGDDPKAATKRLDEAEKDFRSCCEDRIFPGASADLPRAVHDLLRKKQCTLCTAESCTGGMLAGALTAFSGASDYFLGSVVAYSNKVKSSVLQVSQEDLATHGAVSEEVVKQMAEGAQRLTRADFALATSGVAGPTGGTEDKPVGTVWLAIAEKNQPTKAWLLYATGNRAKIIERSVIDALAELYLRLRR